MKKFNSILLILAVAAGFTNCSKADLVENKEAENGGAVVYAITDAVTKTALSNDYKVLWSTGDKIKFVNTETPATTYTFTLSEGAGTTSGTFTGDIPADGEYTVYYPAAYDGSNWPAQTYVDATDISGAPMKATATVTGGEVSDISFKNEGGILRYTVKGSKTIKSINVKSGSTLDVTLDCGTSGVALTAEGAVFNIALPASEYSNATLTFAATDNTTATKTASSFKVTKNVISLATFEASALSFVAPPADYAEIGGVKWATKNLGATTVAGSYETCAGDYYAWGETEPYYDTHTWGGAYIRSSDWKTGKENGYVWQSYCGSSEFSEWSTPPYDNTTKILTPDSDPAKQKLGDGWRMPTSAEFKALYDACFNGSYDKTTYTSNACGATTSFAKGIYWCGNYDGVAGVLFCDGTNKVFFPAAGVSEEKVLKTAGSGGLYWSASLTSDSAAGKAYNLLFNSSVVNSQGSTLRYLGLPVRPVSTEGVGPAPAATTGTAKATIGGSEVEVNWVQLWENGPKFAEYNVGAANSKAEDYGGYYCWGKTTDKDETGTYKTGTDALSGDDDTATKLWGSNWRMPTQTELQGLLDNCTVAWTTVNSKNGCRFTGKGAYESNSVFLPAAGYCGCGDVGEQGDYGYYWSSTPNGSDGAYYLYFDSGSQDVDGTDRDYGFSVRAVLAEED